jgi:hypothetical protein
VSFPEALRAGVRGSAALVPADLHRHDLNSTNRTCPSIYLPSFGAVLGEMAGVDLAGSLLEGPGDIHAPDRID